eukprot:TRINITY_DN4092_c0_g2_i4.p1 TRINITY_DN4092_c0_g2~~TRINITY_DN4092_c0_g2_i4.p1  ORF type:complete len:135 (-),score=29.01 TRINITY_DN4092_c0_g2_i4:79-483(-)
MTKSLSALSRLSLRMNEEDSDQRTYQPSELAFSFNFAANLKELNSEARKRNIKRRYISSRTSRQFYELCEQMMRTMKEEDPRVVYADKSKMFQHIVDHGVPLHKWQPAIAELCKKEENNWAYGEVYSRKFKLHK